MLLPIPIVLRLNLPLRQRIIVALLFGVGFIVCFAGVVRTYYMYKVTDGYHDVTWDAYPVWLGTAVELYLGIVRLSHLLSSKAKIQELTITGLHISTTNKAFLRSLPSKPAFCNSKPELDIHF